MTRHAIADARHVLAVQRAQRAVLARTPRAAKRSRWRQVHDWTWFLTWNCGVPFTVVAMAATDATAENEALLTFVWAPESNEQIRAVA